MIWMFSTALGAAIGAGLAARRKGARLDILHYAAGYGLAFFLLGVIATVVLDRVIAG